MCWMSLERESRELGYGEHLVDDADGARRGTMGCFVERWIFSPQATR